MANSDEDNHYHSCISVTESGQQIPHAYPYTEIPEGKWSASTSEVRIFKKREMTLVKEKNSLQNWMLSNGQPDISLIQ